MSIVCICEICGKEKITIPSRFRRFCSNTCKFKWRSIRNKERGIKPPPRTGIVPSLHQRMAQSKALKGDKCYLWRGGVGRWRPKSIEYKLWREAVFKRDNWTCVWCKKRGIVIQADHIKPYAYFPELRYELSNGRTLCIPCHKLTDTYGNKAKKLYDTKFSNI